MMVRRRFQALVRNLLHKWRVDRDFEEELRGFEGLLVDENIAKGMDPAEARRLARLEVGGSFEGVKELVREVRMGVTLDNIWRDIRLSARALRKQPGFTLAVLWVLTFGIAGTTAIFSIFNSLYLRPLPYPDPEQLVNIDEKAPRWNLERTAVAYPDFHAWREHNRTFDAMSVIRPGAVTVTSDNGAQQVPVARATHDLLKVLKAQPVIGRWFTAEEDIPNGPRVIVVSQSLWQSRFGAPATVSGQTLRLAAQTYEIIGVMPPGFDFPSRTEIWTPLGSSPNDNSGWGLAGVGRLKPGVTIASAQEDLTRVHKGMIPTRKVNEITTPTVYTLREWSVGQYLAAAQILLVSVAVVMLIACANIAGIVLARGSARTREVSVLAALGAPRMRIIRQLLSESVLLGVAGGVLGTGLGLLGLRLLLSLMPANQMPSWVRFEMDWRFLGFCLMVSIGSAMLFGLWPAWNASRADLRTALHDASSRTSDSPARRRSLKILITAEVVLATILLTSAVLLTQAFQKVGKVDPGFRADHVLTYSIGLPNEKYPAPEKRLAFLEELLRQNRALPGVQHAAAASGAPLGGHWGNFYEVEGAPPKRAGDPDPVVLKRVVTPGYLEAMGITLRAGRTFGEEDGRKEGAEAVIVNETFANLYWRGQNPIGKRLRPNGGKTWWPVVGMIADVKDYGLDRESRPSAYFPMAMEPQTGMVVAIRTSAQDPASLTSAAREVLKRLDPDIALARPNTMEQLLANSLWIRRTYSFLVATFAVLALLLVASGLFGVISYTTSQRSREIAIRMALGAGQKRILRGVLVEALAVSLTGLALGVAGALALARLTSSAGINSMLFGVNPRDPIVYTVAALVLATVALSASLIPAFRASRTSPSAALRLE